MSFKDICNFALHIGQYWNARRGLAFVTIAIVVAYFLTPLQVFNTGTARFNTFALIWVGYAMAWLASRMWPKHNSWIVMVALEADEDAETALKKALRGLKRRLQQLSTSHRIIIRKFYHEEVQSRGDADLLLNSNRADVVIWGLFKDGTANGKNISVLEPINYTHRLTPLMRHNLKLYERDLDIVVGQRDWLVRHDESITTVTTLQEDIGDVCLFIIAVQMFGARDAVDDSVLIFDRLWQDAVKLKKDIVAELLKSFLEQGVFIQYMFASADSDWDLALGRMQYLQSLGVEGFGIMTSLARVYYELGDEQASRHYVAEMELQYPTEPPTLFNIAFFAIVDGDYEKAWHVYERIYRLKKMDDSPRHVIDFFTIRIKRGDSEIAYLYCRGMVHVRYQDRKQGIRDLSDFIRKAHGSEAHESMMYSAMAILKAAEKTQELEDQKRLEKMRQKRKDKRRRRGR